jgi:hypothetical protein
MKASVQILLKGILTLIVGVFLAGSATQAGTWDATINFGYPGYAVTDIVSAGGIIYVADGATLWQWDPIGLWQVVADSSISHMATKRIFVKGHNLYTAGSAYLTSDASWHGGIFVWNFATDEWAQIGGDVPGLLYEDVNAIAVGADSYVYIGGHWAITLPNGQIANEIARWSMVGGGGWDNMQGGMTISPATSDLTEVSTIQTAQDTYGSGLVRTLVYIGGQFTVTCADGATSHNTVVFESVPTVGQRYVGALSPTGIDGVTEWVYDCGSGTWSLDDNGPFVRKIIAAPNGDVLMAGVFENAGGSYGSCSAPAGGGAGFRGLAKVVKTATSSTVNTYSLSSWAADMDTAIDYQGDVIWLSGTDLRALSYGGANRYVGGQFTKWGSQSTTPTDPVPDDEFGQGGATGTGVFVSEVGGVSPGGIIGAISLGTSATDPVYVGGDFGITKYTP